MHFWGLGSDLCGVSTVKLGDVVRSEGYDKRYDIEIVKQHCPIAGLRLQGRGRGVLGVNSRSRDVG